MRFDMYIYCLKKPLRHRSRCSTDCSVNEGIFERMYRDTMRRIPGLKPRGFLHTGLLRTYRTEATE